MEGSFNMMATIQNWRDGEFEYCRQLVLTCGDENVSHDPKHVAHYLRLQAAAAYRDGEIVACARLSQAAFYVNCDARNSHTPDWGLALAVLTFG